MKTFVSTKPDLFLALEHAVGLGVDLSLLGWRDISLLLLLSGARFRVRGMGCIGHRILSLAGESKFCLRERVALCFFQFVLFHIRFLLGHQWGQVSSRRRSIASLLRHTTEKLMEEFLAASPDEAT